MITFTEADLEHTTGLLIPCVDTPVSDTGYVVTLSKLSLSSCVQSMCEEVVSGTLGPEDSHRSPQGQK